MLISCIDKPFVFNISENKRNNDVHTHNYYVIIINNHLKYILLYISK